MSIFVLEKSVYDSMEIMGHVFVCLHEIERAVEVDCRIRKSLSGSRDIQRRNDARPIAGIHVARLYEPYPCFDSSDYAEETRYYSNYFFSDKPFTDDCLNRLAEIKNKGNYRLVSEETPECAAPAIYRNADSENVTVAYYVIPSESCFETKADFHEHIVHESESGVFLCDGNDIVQEFIPSESNVINDGVSVETEYDGTVKYENALRSLIVPDGVRGFCSHFLRGWAVSECVRFPDTLQEIGRCYSFRLEDNRRNRICVFADCCLPEINIPSSVSHIGTFAFGNSRIRKLVMNGIPECDYLRQFKDARIEEISFPKDIYMHLNAEGKTDDDIIRIFHVFSYRDIDKVSVHTSSPSSSIMDASSPTSPIMEAIRMRFPGSFPL